MWTIISLFLVYFFFVVSPAQAYLDPGTGSYVTQLFIGGLIGGGYLVKLYGRKIVNVFKKVMEKFSRK